MKVIGRLLMIVVLLFLLSYTMALFLPYKGVIGGNIAKIYIDGVIVTKKAESFFGRDAVASTDLVKQIKDAEANPSIKGIIFEVNSPGGSAVASSEISKAILETDKATVAVIREIGTSGAYWAASAADYVVANEFSVTGSIGVISSYLEFSKLFEKYGVTYQRLVSGQYKDIGTPYKSMTGEERVIMQEKINKIHDVFVSKVASNRNMSFENIKALATGEFYLGSEALDNGLIDKIGDEETAKNYLKKRLNLTKVSVAEYRKRIGFLDMFGGVLNENFYFLGKGISSFMEAEEKGIKT